MDVPVGISVTLGIVAILFIIELFKDVLHMLFDARRPDKRDRTSSTGQTRSRQKEVSAVQKKAKKRSEIEQWHRTTSENELHEELQRPAVDVTPPKQTEQTQRTATTDEDQKPWLHIDDTAFPDRHGHRSNSANKNAEDRNARSSERNRSTRQSKQAHSSHGKEPRECPIAAEHTGLEKRKNSQDNLRDESRQCLHRNVPESQLCPMVGKDETSTDWYTRSKDAELGGRGFAFSAKICQQQMNKSESESGTELFYKPSLKETDLRDKLLHDPQRYKRCQLKIQSAHRSIAKVLEKEENVKEIVIEGRSKCGQTFNEDEVVVEILSRTQEGKRRAGRKDSVVHGQVLGVLNRVHCPDVEHPVLICTLHSSEEHLMKPLCKTVPNIRILNSKEHKNVIAVKRIQNGRVCHEGFVSINPDEREHYVFAVLYLRWDPTKLYPLGAVLGWQKTSKSCKEAETLLSLRYQIPNLYPREAVDDTERLLESDLDTHAKDIRQKNITDLRNKRVFTVDNVDSKDLDDALSVWMDENDHYVVGVHISDVAAFVKEGTALDDEARKRAVTFYPREGKPHHMFPEPLSEDLFSLLPGRERRTLSIFHKFDKDLKKVGEPEIKRANIASCAKLSYTQVQRVITEGTSSDLDEDLKKDILLLHKITSHLHKNRTKTPWSFVPWLFEDPRIKGLDCFMDSIDAHILVQELMILTNAHVAKYLMSPEKYPDQMILRCHAEPTQDQMQNWKAKDGGVADLVMNLKDKNVATACDSLCPKRDIVVHAKLWKSLQWHLQHEKLEKASRIAFTDGFHPLQYLANNHWMDLMDTAQYRCSHGLNPPDHYHFGLGLQCYTHFTSPIRRYADLHVHRLLHAHLDNTAPRCSPDDVTRLCQELNSATARQKAFGKGCLSLKIAESLQRQPLMFRCFVDQVDSEQLTLMVPSLQAVSDRKQELPFSILGVSSQPVVTNDPAKKLDTVTVKWKKRIFNKRKTHAYPKSVFNMIRTQERSQAEQSQAGQGEQARGKIPPVVLHINPHYLCVQVKNEDWARILEMFAESSDQQLFHDLPEPVPNDQWLLDFMTSERDNDADSVRPRHFSVKFSPGQVLRVQMSAAPSRGILQPRVDLVHTASNASVCTQHVGQPVLTLTTFAKRSTRDQNFKTCASYVDAWMPLLEMEAAYGAGGSDEAFVVEDVDLKLEPDGAPDSTGTVQYRGEFELDSEFCFDRCIDIGGKSPDSVRDKTDEDRKEGAEGAFPLEKKVSRGFPVDYVCIRYHTKCPDPVLSLVRNYPVPEAVDTHYTWIGHAGILDAYRMNPKKIKDQLQSNFDPRHQTLPHGRRQKTKRAEESQSKRRAESLDASHDVKQENDEDDPMKITVVLCPSCPKPPTDLLKDGATVTLEILPKTEVDRRAQQYLTALSEESSEKTKGKNGPQLNLAQAVAYGQSIPVLDRNHLVLGALAANQDIHNMPEVKLPKNNDMQQKAIRTALTNSLSLIQGPPGTGKTYTGIKLVYLMCMINRRLESEGKGKKTVLFCGPSNKSVDLVAKLLKKRLDSVCPKIVRMYGSAIESEDYPIPRGNMKQSRSMMGPKSDLELRDISLHHLIRQYGKPYAEEIAKYEIVFERCRRHPKQYKLGREDVKAYRKLVHDASVRELQEYDVILTTCAVAGSPKLVEGTQGTVFQVIIDECAMSTEPHSLVPIIATKAKQVVLIGDHKQLRPIITCQAAAELGLDQSLFERLFEKFPKVTVFLDTQYRMHPAICHFPSNAFYGGRLQTQFRYLERDGTVEPLPLWTRDFRNKEVPHILVDVRGEEQTLTVSTEQGNENSKSNDKEANTVMNILAYLAKHGVHQRNVKVLTQYNAQRTVLQEKMEKLAEKGSFGRNWSWHSIKQNVSTVVSSQGGEWDYVILSTVRSLPSYKIEPKPTYGWCRQNLGFITDKNQINVALTRARKGLIIVGNKELLQCDEVLRELVARYEELKCIRTDSEFRPAQSSSRA